MQNVLFHVPPLLVHALITDWEALQFPPELGMRQAHVRSSSTPPQLWHQSVWLEVQALVTSAPEHVQLVWLNMPPR
ncbi:MAG: hypothetical protein ABW208_27445 [Pyrinomonadaceae bacterium]